MSQPQDQETRTNQLASPVFSLRSYGEINSTQPDESVNMGHHGVHMHTEDAKHAMDNRRSNALPLESSGDKSGKYNFTKDSI